MNQLPKLERQALIRRRRRAVVKADAPTVGLALSGGGTRSATFSLGVIRGLAQKGLLSRVDYLSTVSGGGYVGATIGRAFVAYRRTRSAAHGVTRGLARSATTFLAWLRQKGRYLTPAGSGDRSMVAARALRCFVAAQFVLALFGLFLGLLVVLPHVLHVSFGTSLWIDTDRPTGLENTFSALGEASLWFQYVVLLFFALAPPLMLAYWSTQLKSAKANWIARLLLGFGTLILASVWIEKRTPSVWQMPEVMGMIVLLGLSLGSLVPSAYAFLRGDLYTPGQVGQERLNYTRALRWVLVSSGLLILVVSFVRPITSASKDHTALCDRPQAGAQPRRATGDLGVADPSIQPGDGLEYGKDPEHC